MSNDWIYIGADIDKKEWSKVGKTTINPQKRHTSSQNPGYFIYTAYNIVEGNVHEIESELLKHLDADVGCKRLSHFSTGSQSECFSINPNKMEHLVERFIEVYYPSSVKYDPVFNIISRYQCDNDVYNSFREEMKQNLSQNLEGWFDSPKEALPRNLQVSEKHYFTGNQIRHEVDLGSGYFIDLETGMQGYRDEDGNIDWEE